LPRAGEAEATLEQHRAIIRALASKNPAQASEAMRDHLNAAYRSTTALLDREGMS
jgi:DNA-binding GntR family transcriptional regulator